MWMRSSTTAWLVALVLTGGLISGCESANDSDDESTGSTPTGSSDEVALRDAPEIGTCWQVPDGAATDQDYWFDDSPQVPCTDSHNTETANVFQVPEPTVEAATAMFDSCWDAARLHVDVDLDHWVPWMVAVFLPSQEQVDAGASFVRCDVAFPSSLAYDEHTSLTGSIENAATTRAQELLPCLDGRTVRSKQPFVSCGQPHRFEATGQLAVTEYGTGPPSAKELRDEVGQCRDGLPRHQSTPQHAVDVAWDRPDTTEGGRLSGVCFVYLRNGSLLPERR